MNAGIADAANLSWLLAAHLNGWADGAVLDAYECERLPITDQVSRFVMNHTHAMVRQRRAVPDEIETAGAAGDALRREIGQLPMISTFGNIVLPGSILDISTMDLPSSATKRRSHQPIPWQALRRLLCPAADCLTSFFRMVFFCTTCWGRSSPY
ncbi:MAG: hypothetical protein Ct9H300mP16_19760 [Pseudomonadota bacterium]|nr:MAG: hypothetical protein Ct9H300mP16_19760 [Pseudomonadota bacterium]